jgi:Xaa-Pro aminopeptidase
MDTQPKESLVGKASHDAPDLPDALVSFMSSHWAERATASSAHPEAARFAARRAELSRAFPGEHLVVPAGEEMVRANDTNFRFRLSSDAAYLLGGGEPGDVLVLEPNGRGHRSLLFAQPHNRGTKDFFDRIHGELWSGPHRGVDESKAFYGVDECLPVGQLDAYLAGVRAANHALRVLPDDAELAAHTAEMRLIKDDYELAELRKAVAVSKRAFEDCIRTMHDAKSEREIEAAFWSRARIEANDVGYLTIAAAADHACTLHWTHNDGAMGKGDLLLLDAGVECDSLYTADITRTLPVGGTFSSEQRAVYDLVYASQQAAMAIVRPGIDFLEPHRTAMRVLAQGLIDLGILQCSFDEAMDRDHQYYRRSTLHGVSHMLGIDVHDCARARSETYRYGQLQEGMVLTVEPGLYFHRDDETVPERFRGIGVRIEDDVAVTATGFENLSASLPSTSADVERWIAEVWS